VRDGAWLGATGKQLTTVVAVGIGGSYLGPEFLFEALSTDGSCAAAAEGRTLKFLANVDPVDFARVRRTRKKRTTRLFFRAWLRLFLRTLSRRIFSRCPVAGRTHALAFVWPAACQATRGLDPEATLVVVVSKTFTTAETMLNARTLRQWLWDGMKGKASREAVANQHLAACSTALDKVRALFLSGLRRRRAHMPIH